MFCYEHGTEILNKNLGKHLKTFGINIASSEKTEKSMAELQLEQNMKFDFNMATEDGKELEFLHGPGFTGIKNLGNSCYIASVVQVLFSVPEIQDYYVNSWKDHLQNCNEVPAHCFRCQMGKMGEGLLSGRYSIPDIGKSISPSMFKNIVSKGNQEFQSMRQQVFSFKEDASEFMQHLIATIKRVENPNRCDPSSCFDFVSENRLQCFDCKRVHYSSDTSGAIILQIPAITDGIDENGKVKYKEADLIDLVKQHFEPETRQFTCPQDNTKTTAVWFNSLTQHAKIFNVP